MSQEENKNQSEKEATFSQLFEFNLDRFLEELSALNDTLPIQMILLDIKHKELIKKLEKISKKTDGKSEDGKPVTKYKVLNEQIDEFSKIHKHLTRTDISKKILPRNFIVSIVSQYDAFLGELVRTLYNINPNIIRSSEKELNIEDLFNYETIDELKQHLVDKEVDALLREEHYEQFKILEKRISVVTGKDFTLTTDLPILPYFIELTQRRNLFVHTNGMSTRQYLEFKKKWKFISECTGDINEELEANPDYCKKAYEILFEISVKLTHVLWRKFAPKEKKEADIHLNQVIFDLLVDGQYQLAIIICDFATEVLKKFSTEQLRKFIIINKAIAFKLLDKEPECKRVIQNEDWTIGNEFKLAKLILEDRFKDAKDLMLKIGDKDELVNKKAYESWPLFKLFRKSQEFKEAYLELFKEEYSIEEVQKKSLEKDDVETETRDFEIEIEFEKEDEE
jgi:glutaredoxin